MPSEQDVKVTGRLALFDIRNSDLVYLSVLTSDGYWELVGGGVEGDESQIEAAIRECWEEARVVPEQVYSGSGISYGYHRANQNKPRKTLILPARFDSTKERELSHEHEDEHLGSYEKTLSLLKYQDQIKGFEAIHLRIVDIVKQTRQPNYRQNPTLNRPYMPHSA